MSWEHALANVRVLWEDAQFASTFEAEPAETLLEEARATGLLNLEDALQGAFSGRAWLPPALPAGVSGTDIQ